MGGIPRDMTDLIDEGMAPPPVVPSSGATVDARNDELIHARSKKHLMTHTIVCVGCDGCLAKTRAKPHYRKAFKKDDPKYKHVITMEQLTVRDDFGTSGVCGYRYGIVLYHVGKQYWSFTPLRTMTTKGTEKTFRELLHGDAIRHPLHVGL